MPNTTELIRSIPIIEDGTTDSYLDGVRFFKATQRRHRLPVVYNPGICVVVQGRKVAYLGDEKFNYDANQYLVTSVTTPFEAELFASPEEPLLGMFVDIDLGQLNELINRIGVPAKLLNGRHTRLPKAVGPAEMDSRIRDSLIRLVQCLRSETEAQILGPGLVREVLFRALMGSQAPMLYSLAMNSGVFSQVARALQVIQNEYSQKLDVNKLANTAHMSASAFHHAFKEITSESPMQYLKKLRLSKARDLIMQQDRKTYMVAQEVGYESASQFSREFKRYFGQSPAGMVRQQAAS